MVVIITDIRPVAAFYNTVASIECRIKGMAKHHVASWFHEEKLITFGEELLDYDNRHDFQLFQHVIDGIHMSTLDITTAHKGHEGMYVMKVYERGPNGTLNVVAQKNIAHLEIQLKYENECPRLRGGALETKLSTGGGISIESLLDPDRYLLVSGFEMEIKTLEVKGIDKGHVVCWCLNGKVLTRGEKVVEECQKHRLVPQIKENGVFSYYYTLTIKNAQPTDEGTYSLRVYEAGLELQNMLVTSDITYVKILY